MDGQVLGYGLLGPSGERLSQWMRGQLVGTGQGLCFLDLTMSGIPQPWVTDSGAMVKHPEWEASLQVRPVREWGLSPLPTPPHPPPPTTQQGQPLMSHLQFIFA